MSDKVVHMMNLSPKTATRSKAEALISGDPTLEERVQLLETFARVMAVRMINNGKEMNEDGESIAVLFTRK